MNFQKIRGSRASSNSISGRRPSPAPCTADPLTHAHIFHCCTLLYAEHCVCLIQLSTSPLRCFRTIPLLCHTVRQHTSSLALPLALPSCLNCHACSHDNSSDSQSEIHLLTASYSYLSSALTTSHRMSAAPSAPLVAQPGHMATRDKLILEEEEYEYVQERHREKNPRLHRRTIS